MSLQHRQATARANACPKCPPHHHHHHHHTHTHTHKAQHNTPHPHALSSQCRGAPALGHGEGVDCTALARRSVPHLASPRSTRCSASGRRGCGRRTSSGATVRCTRSTGRRRGGRRSALARQRRWRSCGGSCCAHSRARARPRCCAARCRRWWCQREEVEAPSRMVEGTARGSRRGRGDGTSDHIHNRPRRLVDAGVR